MPEDSEALIRSLYETWNAEGVETFRVHCTEDVVWHDDPQIPDATTSAGIDAVVARFGTITDTIGHFRIDVRETGTLGDGRLYALVAITARGQGSGVELSDDHLHVLRIEDGRVREFWLHLDADRARGELGLTS